MTTWSPSLAPALSTDSHLRKLQCLLLALQELPAARTPQAIHHIVLDAARQMASSAAATLSLRDGQHCHFVAEESASPLWPGRRLRLRDCLDGWVMEHKFPAIIPDIHADPRTRLPLYESTFIASLVIVPLRSSQPVGTLGIFWTQKQSFPAEDLPLLQALADATATALDNLRSRAALERRLDERNQQLLAAEQELQKSLEAEKAARHSARAVSRTKADFLAMLSREIRTPLNGVIGLNALLLDTGLSNQQRMLVDLARLSGDALLRLLGEILDLSKLEAGFLEVESQEFNPRRSLEDIVQQVRQRACHEDVQLELQISPDIDLLLRGDAGRLEQILTLHLDHAIAQSGSRQLLLACDIAASSNREVLALRITARDRSGHAVTPATGTPQPESSALSLAIARQIMELMGGRQIVAHGDENCLLALEIPFTRLVQAEEPPLLLPETGDSPGGNARVLVVEANAINQLVARKMLTRLGCSVDVVSCRDAALETARRQHYRLIFLDAEAGNAMTFATHRALRALEKAEHTPIIAVSASALAGECTRYLEAGFDDYLAKPLQPAEVSALLGRQLKKRAH